MSSRLRIGNAHHRRPQVQPHRQACASGASDTSYYVTVHKIVLYVFLASRASVVSRWVGMRASNLAINNEALVARIDEPIRDLYC